MTAANVEQPPTLVAALAKIQHRLPVVTKDSTAKVKTRQGGEYSYSYADLADFAKAVYPLLGEVGLAFVARPVFRDDGRYVLVGSLMHESGDVERGEFPIVGSDSQAIGSSITYGRRYLLGCLTGAVSDTDDDDGARVSQHQRQANNRPPTETSSRDNANDDALAAWKDKIAAADTATAINEIGAEIAGSTLTPQQRSTLKPLFQERLALVVARNQTAS